MLTQADCATLFAASMGTLGVQVFDGGVVGVDIATGASLHAFEWNVTSCAIGYGFIVLFGAESLVLNQAFETVAQVQGVCGSVYSIDDVVYLLLLTQSQGVQIRVLPGLDVVWQAERFDMLPAVIENGALDESDETAPRIVQVLVKHMSPCTYLFVCIC